MNVQKMKKKKERKKKRKRSAACHSKPRKDVFRTLDLDQRLC